MRFDPTGFPGDDEPPWLNDEEDDEPEHPEKQTDRSRTNRDPATRHGTPPGISFTIGNQSNADGANVLSENYFRMLSRAVRVSMIVRALARDNVPASIAFKHDGCGVRINGAPPRRASQHVRQGGAVWKHQAAWLSLLQK